MLILGVVKLVVPVPPDKTEPPVNAAYQSIVSPELTLALIATVPVPILEPSTPDVGLLGKGFTVATTAVLVAVVQPLVVAST